MAAEMRCAVPSSKTGSGARDGGCTKGIAGAGSLATGVAAGCAAALAFGLAAPLCARAGLASATQMRDAESTPMQVLRGADILLELTDIENLSQPDGALGRHRIVDRHTT